MSQPTFALQIAAFAKKAGTNADAVVRKVIIEVGSRIVERSPVGDGSLWKRPPPKGYTGGRFRGNWQAGENDAPDGELDTIDPSGAVSIARITAAVPPQASGRKFVIANNLPYAQRLEDGWSKQAPAGMVGLVVEEFSSIVDQAAVEVNK